jgi:predicted homoserine dehydrogenase-like protein
LPLAARATVVREVPVDQSLTYDDVELDDGSTILQVRRLQDLLLWNGPPTSRPSVPGP